MTDINNANTETLKTDSTDDSIVFDITQGTPEELVKEIVEEVAKVDKPKKSRKAKVEKPVVVEDSLPTDEVVEVEKPAKVKKERKPRTKKEKVELRPVLVPLSKEMSDRYHALCKANGTNATAKAREMIEAYMESGK
jgi:hypothetical protein